MQISDMLGQYNRNTANGTEELKTNQGVERLVSRVRDLSAGSVFEGTVNFTKGGRMVLTLANGEQISARMDGKVPVKQGSAMFFQVRSNDGTTIAIRPYTGAGLGGNPILRNALAAAQLPVTERNLAMVDAMMREQMPIDRQSLSQMIRVVDGHAGANVQTLVQMTKLGMPVTAAMASQFENYMADRHSLLNEMELLTAQLSEMMGGEDMEPEAALRLYAQVTEIFAGEGTAGAGTGIRAGAGFAAGGGVQIGAGANTAANVGAGVATAPGASTNLFPGSGQTPGMGAVQTQVAQTQVAQTQIASGAEPGAVSTEAGIAAQPGAPANAVPGAGQITEPGVPTNMVPGTGQTAVPGALQSMQGFPEGANPAAHILAADGGAGAWPGMATEPGIPTNMAPGAGQTIVPGAQPASGVSYQPTFDAAPTPPATLGDLFSGEQLARLTKELQAIPALSQASGIFVEEETELYVDTMQDETVPTPGEKLHPADPGRPDLSGRPALPGRPTLLGGNETPRTLRTDLTAAQFLRTLQQELTDNRYLGLHGLQRLFAGKEFARVLKEAAGQQWMIRPKELRREGGVEELYERLNVQLKQLDAAVRAAGTGPNPAQQTVADMRGNLEFMNQMNQIYHYVQLPLQMSGRNANGELYVYSNRKRFTDPEAELTAFLHLDLESLGSTDVSVRMQHRQVKTNFYLENDAAYTLIERHLPILEKRLRQKGYQCQVAVTKEKRDSSFAENFVKKGRPQASGQTLRRYSFDVRM